MGRTFFTLALMAALLLAGGGAGATSIVQGDGLTYDTVHNVTLLEAGNLCVALGNCVDSINPAMPLADVNTWTASSSSGGFTGRGVSSMEVNGPTNRLTGNQGPPTDIQSKGSGLFANSATLFLIGVGS